MDDQKLINMVRASMSRRQMLAGMAAAGLGTLRPDLAFAQSRPVETLGVGSLFGPTLKPIVEKEGKVSLTNGPFQSTVDAVSRLTAPGGTQYDLIISSFDFSRPVVMGSKSGEEKVLPIDTKRVDLKNVNAVSQYAIGARDDKTYIVPLVWGYDTVLYNTEKVPLEDAQSWSLLFEDKYAGRIAWWDTPLNTLMAASLYLGHKEPERMDRKQLDEVGKFLISKKKNVRTIFSSFAQGTNLLASGEVVAAYGIISMRTELQEKGLPITGAWCKEGVLSVVQSGYIPKSSARAEAANDVINAMLSKEFARAVTLASGYLSTSKLAEGQFSAEEKSRYGFGLFDGSIKFYPQKFPLVMTDWIEVWSRVKAA